MTASISFTADETYELYYATREAMVRFKRAKTELLNGNEGYSHWDEETLDEKINYYYKLGHTVLARYEADTGESIL